MLFIVFLFWKKKKGTEDPRQGKNKNKDENKIKRETKRKAENCQNVLTFM